MTPLSVVALHIAAAAAYLAGLRGRTRGGALFIAAACLHAATLVWHLWPDARSGLGVVLSLFMLVAGCEARRTLRADTVRQIALPLTAGAALAPLWLMPAAGAPSFSAHAALAVVAYALAASAFLHWLDLRAAERQLRRQPATLAAPLLASETWCFRYLAAAFVVLTLTLLSGGAQAAVKGEAVFALTHKTLFAVLTWFTFLILLAGRHRLGWRGKTARMWFCAGYVFLLLSYVGSTFVAQVILQRG